MIKSVFLLLLALLLLGCSANKSMSGCGQNCNGDYNLSKQLNLNMQQIEQSLQSLNDNFSAYHESLFFSIKDVDAQVNELRQYLNTPGLANPDADFLLHQVSDAQLKSYEKQPAIDCGKHADDMRNNIACPDNRMQQGCAATGGCTSGSK